MNAIREYRTTYPQTGDLRPFETTRDLTYRAPRTRLIAGAMARIVSPGYGWCSCCGRPWTICKGKVVGQAFPLCEECFSEMTPQERVPHFLALFQDWQMSSEINGRPFSRDWSAMRDAVLNCA